MTDAQEPLCKISKGITIKGVAGMTLEDKWLTVTGKTLKEVTREFDKRWFKDEKKKDTKGKGSC
jgi:hypothetical protein